LPLGIAQGLISSRTRVTGNGSKPICPHGDKRFIRTGLGSNRGKAIQKK
jgi:hypothetical protein